MYTTTVGHTFLTEYNRRNQTDYSAKSFFDEVYFRLFFDEKKYLMWAQNSPFVQGISKTKPFFIPTERAERLAQFHEKIIRGERDASIAIGYPAAEGKEYATTSGLVTDIEIDISVEDTYLSWIGGSLSIGVAGGFALLFNNAEILYATFEGWQAYRNLLKEPSLDKLNANKIQTWNGQWLTFYFGKRYRKDYDYNIFDAQGFFDKSDTEIGVNTIEWTKLFFSLSWKFPDSVLTGYVFSLGQTNKTLGFFPFHFKSGTTLIGIYQKLTQHESFGKDKKVFESLFGKHIKRACELGAIGLQALEPKNLTKYFSDVNLNLIKPDINPKKDESESEYQERRTKLNNKDAENIITYYSYKTWLIAMLTKNKEEIADYTSKVAAALVKYREGARKNDRKTLLEQKLFANSKRTSFNEGLIEIVSDSSVELPVIEVVKGLRDYIHFLNNEDFVYFWLLLKFDYAYQERISTPTAK